MVRVLREQGRRLKKAILQIALSRDEASKACPNVPNEVTPVKKTMM